MIVTLTHYQSRVLMARIPELHATTMREHREPHGAKAHRYDLPAIAWRQIRDHLWLNPLYYGPLGGKLDSQPKALYRAIQLVHMAVLAIEHHPALTPQHAVLGRQMEIVPAWTLHNAVGWSPYPQTSGPPCPFTLRVPREIELHGMEMTGWHSWEPPVVAGWRWTHYERTHLDFVSAEPQVFAHGQDL